MNTHSLYKISTFQKITSFVLLSVFLQGVSCSSIKKVAINKDVNRYFATSPVLANYFAGFSLYDPVLEKQIAGFNEDKYFTPASNTKILTLAAYLEMNASSIPSFMVSNSYPKLIKPLGDPTFLHPDFSDQKAFNWLINLPDDTLTFIKPKNTITSFGPGWAWDDYMYDFQPERSWFPMFGDIIRIDVINSSYKITPDFFEGFVDVQAEIRDRSKSINLFTISQEDIPSDTSSSIDIPFTINDELLQSLLNDTLNKFITFTNEPYGKLEWNIIYSLRTLPVLATMMQRSDNFLAEQLLYNAQMALNFNSQESYFKYLNQTVYSDLPDSLIWVDGSGLSRYNMITPRNLVAILNKIYKRLTWKEIEYVFPVGGRSGTIKNWYLADEPYIFAKTGTLRHNHCLSGFIKTRSGRILIFSFMNNHYTIATSEVKEEMQKLLENIRDTY